MPISPQENQTSSASIAVVPLFYGRHDVVADCLTSLLDARKREPFSIFAIENPSRHSDENRAWLDRLVDSGQVEGVYFPAENAIFNSLLCALRHDIFRLWDRFDYVVLSDGDVRVQGPFVGEQADILRRYPRVSSVSVRVDIRRWSPRSKHFDAAVIYSAALLNAPADADHVENGSGFWMRMFRTAELRRLVHLFDDNGFRLRDRVIDRIVRTYGMYPACALKTSAIELPNGPLFVAHETTKVLAVEELGRNVLGGILQGRPGVSLWNHDVEPGGLYRTGSEDAVEARLVLAAPCSPEEHHHERDLPPHLAQSLSAFDEAKVVDRLDWDDGHGGLVFIADPPASRVFRTDASGAVVVPFGFLETADQPGLQLRRIGFDTRGLKRTRRSVLLRLFSIARRVLAPGGEVILDAVDWVALARRFASLNARLEDSATSEDAATFARRAGRTALLAREIEQRDFVFDLGTIGRYAAEAGIFVRSVERPPACEDETPFVRFTLGLEALPTPQSGSPSGDSEAGPPQTLEPITGAN